MRNKFMRQFTLVEIVLAFGVLVLLMTFSLYFFSGTKTLWNNMRSRNSAGAASSAALDVIASTLASSVSGSENNFLVVANPVSSAADTFVDIGTAPVGSELAYLTVTPRRLAGVSSNDGLYAVRVKLRVSDAPAEGKLVLQVVPAGTEAVAEFFRPLADSTLDFPPDAAEVVLDDLVSDFIVQLEPDAAAGRIRRPQAITLTLAFFDTAENYRLWRNNPTPEFRLEHERRITRKIAFDDIKILHDEVLR